MPAADGDQTFRPDRKNTSLVGFHAPKEVHRILKILAALEGTTLSAMMYEMVLIRLQNDMSILPPQLQREVMALIKAGSSNEDSDES